LRNGSCVSAASNEVLSENALQLFCAYQIDVFGKEFRAGVINEILCAAKNKTAMATEPCKDCLRLWKAYRYALRACYRIDSFQPQFSTISSSISSSISARNRYSHHPGTIIHMPRNPQPGSA